MPTGLLQNVKYNVLLAHEKGLLTEIDFADMLAELKLASTVVVPHLDWYRAFSVYGRPAHMLRGIVDMRDDVLMNPSPLTFSRQQFFPVQMMPVVESVQKAVASKMGVNFNACLAYKYMTPSDHISPHADNENTVPLFHPPWGTTATLELTHKGNINDKTIPERDREVRDFNVTLLGSVEVTQCCLGAKPSVSRQGSVEKIRRTKKINKF